jgi:hypothetical protein
VGQALGLRRPRRPPGAGPHISLRSCGETSGDRVVFDVPLDALKFITAANQMVVAFVLPKRLAAPLQQQVGPSGSGGFERAEKLRCAHLRGEEEMDVIGHDHNGVRLLMPQFGSVFDRGKNQLSNGWLSEKGGAGAGLIEQPVHCEEGFARSQIRGRKGAIGRKTAVQAERNE